MFSKWFPWDFVKNNPTTIEEQHKGVIVLWSFDPFVEKMLLSRIPKHQFSEGLVTITGNDFTVDWIEENLNTMDMFAGNTSYQILLADQIPQKTRTWLLENQLDLGDRRLIFCFRSDSTFLKSLEKNVPGIYLKVEAPRFWENGKLLTFLADQLGIRLVYDVHAYLLEAVPNTVGDFVNALKTIGLNCPGQIDLKTVRELIQPGRIDQFKLASMLAGKKRVAFFKDLVEIDSNFDDLRSLFSFMQGHLLKLLDPSYIKKKSRPSKYDQEIMAHSRLWSKTELLCEMKTMGELEILAKKKTNQLKRRLEQEYLKEFV